MSLRRFAQLPDVVFAWPLGNQPLQEARERHTVTGNPTQGVGPWGPYLTFDGTNDYVTLGADWEDQLRFDSGAQDFSIVVWVRRAATGATGTIFDKRDASGDGHLFSFLADDRVRFQLNSFEVYGPSTVADTLWHSIIAVVDRGTDLTVYLDGVAGTPAACVAQAMATTTAPRVGARSYDAGSKFDGDAAGLFLIDRVLSSAECLDIATGEAF